MWADCEWFGIKPVLKDDPIYRTGYSISFVPRSRQEALMQVRESESEVQGKPPKKLINRHSKWPEDRDKFLTWLAAMVATLPGQPLLERARDMARLALRDGVDWKDVYEAAVSARPSYYNPAPPADMIDPEK